MKIIVFSDSHGSSSEMERVISLHPDAECYIHLGDGYPELELLRQTYPEKCFCGIAGNSEDWRMAGSPLKPKSETVIELGGYRIFITHGHKYYVKETLYRAKCAAEERKADILLYGHTHRPFFDKVEKADRKPLYIFCPGSIALPYGVSPEYGVITITPSGIDFSHRYLS